VRNPLVLLDLTILNGWNRLFYPQLKKRLSFVLAPSQWLNFEISLAVECIMIYYIKYSKYKDNSIYAKEIKCEAPCVLPLRAQLPQL
jgi:hypothetical protein